MFISLDLETTGFSAENDQIIEFGAIKFDLKGNTESLKILINPQTPIPQIVTYITNITNDHVKDAPTFEEKKQEIQDFIGDLPIVGHNIQFDTGFLRQKGIPLTNDEYDTCQMASILLPGLPSYSLEIISSQLEIKHKEKHRALDDAIAAMELFLTLIKEYEYLSQELIDKFKKLSEKTNWPLKNLLNTLEHKEKATAEEKEKVKIPAPNPEKFKEILDPNAHILFETPQPYDELINTFANHAHKDSYLALPTEMFREIEQDIGDNVAKIDSPRKYISPKRLETFENQEHYEDYEFTAILKYLIWSRYTKTGLLEEVKLFHHEIKTLPKVNIDPTIHPLEEEEFFQKAIKKDENSPAICTHNYIIDTKPEIKDLLILDIDQFTKSLFFQDSYYLRLDIILSQLETLKQLHPENKTVESLISKSTILFGYIGMLHTKFNDHNTYVARTIITNRELNSKDWEGIQEAVRTIVTTSKELSEINNKETKTYLQNWKKSLETLIEIFLTPNIEKNQVWLEETREKDIVIKKSPQTLNESLQTILKNCENYKVIDENIDLNDDGAFIRSLYELPAEMEMKKGQKEEKNIRIFIAEDAPERDHDKAPILNFLKNHLKGKTAVIFNSKQQLQYYTLELSKHLPDLNIASQLTGSLGKVTEQFKEAPEKSVLMLTTGMWKHFKHHDQIDELIIHRLPFEPPSDAFLTAISQKFQNPFMELQTPRAIIQLKSAINRLSSNSEKTVILLDPRAITKRYGKMFVEQIKNISTPENASLSSL